MVVGPVVVGPVVAGPVVVGPVVVGRLVAGCRPVMSGPPARYISTARTRGCVPSVQATPSLAKIELMCFSTARWVMNSDAAIAALLCPCAISLEHLALARR